VIDGGAPAKYRLFFALWPDAALQAWLAGIAGDLQRDLGGKATRQDSIHLTLVFLGDVQAARLDELMAVGDAVACAPFTMTLDTSGCWTHNRIAWVAPSSTPAALAEMVRELQAGVRALGFEVDERPYAPHITLVRKASRSRRTTPLADTAAWPVDHFVLVSSLLDAQGSRYSVIGRWPPAA
jgi:RNA 2',3'-cyclic 3'-phosphodiesterase